MILGAGGAIEQPAGGDDSYATYPLVGSLLAYGTYACYITGSSQSRMGWAEKWG